MRALLDLLVPPRCDGCGVLAAPPWCAACDDRAAARRPSPPCQRCAGPAGSGHACWAPGAPIASTVALTTWRDPVASALLHAKLAGRTEVFHALGPRLAAIVAARPALVVAVPTDRRRARQRGADHTRALARSLAAALGVPAVRALRVAAGGPDRGSAAAAGRAPLPPGTFVGTGAVHTVRERAVLLVDDLVTTGATLAAAAQVLVGAGAARVDAAVVARAGSHPLHG